ncbi:MAG: aminotransferase DegT [Desulfuromonadales bacterium C00003093]|nr:MAG: aminotransferase DegT [Desulfuromonadales bacterium C00003093]
MFEDVIAFIRSLFPGQDFIPLHEPRFIGREKEYVNAAIDSTFVSSVGKFVNRFEDMICQYTGAKHTIATVNGTAALHASLMVAGVENGDEVITQPLTFVATANAIAYCRAHPIFVDVDRDTMGLSPEALKEFLDTRTEQAGGVSRNKNTGRRIAACVPMHTFGHPCRIEQIAEICRERNITLIEDAAESLGSTLHGRQTGTFGRLGIYSFNGNKIITCGGGGVIVTDDQAPAAHAKHLTTTAKKPHPYLYEHDEVGYNYRMPNLNAALACAQMEQLDFFIKHKRQLAAAYKKFFEKSGDIVFVNESENARSNYWLNTVILPDRKTRNTFLEETNNAKIMTRPAWNLLHSLPIYANCQTDGLKNAEWLADRIVNIPSSVRCSELQVKI